MGKKILWLGLLVSLTAQVYATPVRGLYQAQVPLSEDTIAQRALAQSQAMSQVLVKLTGVRATSQAQMVSAVQNAQRYVQRYEVKQAESADSDLSLLVHFDAAGIRALVRELGLPVWNEDRPSTLLLVAIEQGMSRSLLGVEDDPALKNLVIGKAYERAIPLLLPLMDIDDRRNLDVGDLWGGFFERFSSVRDRYGANNLLVGRAYEVQGSWTIRWSLLLATGDREDWETAAAGLQGALTNGVDELADRLAQRFAAVPSAGGGDSLGVVVTRVHSLVDYARVYNYLQKLSAVTNVQVIDLRDGQATFRLSMIGEVHALRAAIGMEAILLPVQSIGAEQDPTVGANALHYQLTQ